MRERNRGRRGHRDRAPGREPACGPKASVSGPYTGMAIAWAAMNKVMVDASPGRVVGQAETGAHGAEPGQQQIDREGGHRAHEAHERDELAFAHAHRAVGWVLWLGGHVRDTVAGRILARGGPNRLDRVAGVATSGGGHNGSRRERTQSQPARREGARHLRIGDPRRPDRRSGQVRGRPRGRLASRPEQHRRRAGRHPPRGSGRGGRHRLERRRLHPLLDRTPRCRGRHRRPRRRDPSVQRLVPRGVPPPLGDRAPSASG